MARQTQSQPTWLALFEHFQQILERNRYANHKLSRLRALLRRRTRWRRSPLLADHLARELEFLEGQLGRSEMSVRDILGQTTKQEAHSEPGLATYGTQIDHELTLCEKRIDLFDQFFTQRQLGMDASSWEVASGPHGDYDDLDQSFRAADACVLGYFLDIFGETWVREKILGAPGGDHWFPIAVFVGGGTYEISLEHLVAYVPEADLLRTRFWPHLAHEIGHLKGEALFSRNTKHLGQLCFQAPENPEDESTWNIQRRVAIERLLPRAQDRSADGLRSLADDHALCMTAMRNAYADIVAKYVPKDQPEAAATSESPGSQSEHDVEPDEEDTKGIAAHLEEFIADAIATAVAGPAALWSFLASGAADPVLGAAQLEEDVVAWQVIHQTHPLSVVRVEFMKRLLHEWRGFVPGSELDTVTANFIARMLQDMTPAGRKIAAVLLALAPTMVPAIARIAKRLTVVEPFGLDSGKNDLDICDNLYKFQNLEEDDLREWAPRYTLNIAWMKRAKVHQVMSRFESTDINTRISLMDSGGSPALGLFPELTRRLARWGQFEFGRISNTRQEY